MSTAVGLTTHEKQFYSNLNPFTVSRFSVEQSVYADEPVSHKTGIALNQLAKLF